MEVLKEIERAMSKCPPWPTDPLHAVAVVGEEFGELMKAVVEHTYEPQKSTREDVRTEAMQLACVALRFVMSLDRYEFVGCDQHNQAIEDLESA